MCSLDVLLSGFGGGWRGQQGGCMGIHGDGGRGRGLGWGRAIRQCWWRTEWEVFAKSVWAAKGEGSYIRKPTSSSFDGDEFEDSSFLPAHITSAICFPKL
jgi:hypothetical protein